MKKRTLIGLQLHLLDRIWFSFIIFVCIPTLYGVYASFTQWNLISDPVWIGLNNYKTLLFDSSSTFYTQFWNGLKNTFIFVLIMVPFTDHYSFDDCSGSTT